MSQPTNQQVTTVAKTLWEQAPDCVGDWDRLPTSWQNDMRTIALDALRRANGERQ